MNKKRLDRLQKLLNEIEFPGGELLADLFADIRAIRHRWARQGQTLRSAEEMAEYQPVFEKVALERIREAVAARGRGAALDYARSCKTDLAAVYGQDNVLEFAAKAREIVQNTPEPAQNRFKIAPNEPLPDQDAA